MKGRGLSGKPLFFKLVERKGFEVAVDHLIRNAVSAGKRKSHQAVRGPQPIHVVCRYHLFLKRFSPLQTFSEAHECG